MSHQKICGCDNAEPILSDPHQCKRRAVCFAEADELFSRKRVFNTDCLKGYIEHRTRPVIVKGEKKYVFCPHWGVSANGENIPLDPLVLDLAGSNWSPEAEEQPETFTDCV